MQASSSRLEVFQWLIVTEKCPLFLTILLLLGYRRSHCENVWDCSGPAADLWHSLATFLMPPKLQNDKKGNNSLFHLKVPRLSVINELTKIAVGRNWEEQ